MENAIKKITYVLSFLNFVSKIVLATMLWMQYIKAANNRNKTPSTQNTGRGPIGSIEFGSNYMS
jgi:hypothetical protein